MSFCCGAFALVTNSTTTTTEITTTTDETTITNVDTTTDATTTYFITTTARTASSDNQLVVFFNRALSLIDSASVFIQPISNVILGFMLIKMFVIENDRGCKLPNGLRVQNGWHELSTDCQEECFCMKNKFHCRPKPCDLNENQCVTDAFGEHFCYPTKNLNCNDPETIGSPGTTITPESTITADTTITSNTTITPSFSIDRVIDIAANQQVGTIDNYYDNYEFSMEARLHNLTMDGIYTNSSILGFLITKIEILVPFIKSAPFIKI